jgi:hypothetical protein
MFDAEWTEIEGRDGRFLVNWNGVWSICYSCARASAMVRLATTREFYAWDLKESLKTFGTIGPHYHPPVVSRVEVDWDRVTAEALADTIEHMAELRMESQISMCNMIDRLKMLRYTTIRCNEKFGELLKAGHKATMRSMENAVERGEFTVEILKFVRDFCAETVIVSAAFLPGGGTLRLLTSGSALKGYAKYTDTQNWKSAWATFGVEIGFGLVGIKISALKNANKLRWETATSSTLEGILAAQKARKVDTLVGVLAFVIPAAKASAEIPLAILENKAVLQGMAAAGTKLAANVPISTAKSVLEKSLGKVGAVFATAALAYNKTAAAKYAASRAKPTKMTAPILNKPIDFPDIMAAAVPIQRFIELTAVKQTGSVMLW